jgi:Zinc dependent phospholipase C
MHAFISRLLAIALFLTTTGSTFGYSVLSHEALIDALWEPMLRPAILARFPGTPPEQLKDAHAYAYGGSIIQDMGFYPHGSGYFSDLTHYVRAGDFINALLADARTPNDLAFALGALSHFAGDCDGHRLGTNIGEALLYPKLVKKYGTPLTYEDDPSKHLKTEFGFDVLEVAKGNFASSAYHDFIGFKVAAAVLERAFRETYGFEMSTLFNDLQEAIGSYRRTVSNLVPLATRVAWAEHEDEIQQSRPGLTRRQFLFVMKRSRYESTWGKEYRRPSAWERFLAVLLRLIPPIGPLKTLRYKPLTPQVEQYFMHSFTVAVQHYRKQIESVQAKKPEIANLNFDTGEATPPTKYRLQDESYSFWLGQLAQNHYANLTPTIRDAILTYYSNLELPFATKKHRKQWRTVLLELRDLKSAPITQSTLD